ncbi:CRISPR-associated helicase Cas3' [Guyparkeria hydrothermalis]|uniref:CRISPR-associated helicase Cas3' n=1 Tax=Guyparkeria hydrothermalis TaxID=923 RepID=UPI002020CF8F|nr:CRISPR-associated helicase Cas3' [Guyparkeria hydrothermalis]MCL7750267.1 CRISPR-associated helicase Cas3' [Guyparkeria hydrothermalis]
MRRRRNTRTDPELPLGIFAHCPAKTRTDQLGRTSIGRNVLEHCLTVGAVAARLEVAFPKAFRELLFPDGSPLVAGAHDLGKVSPTFVAKILRAIDSECAVDPTLLRAVAGFDPDIEKNWGGHAGVSQCAATSMGAPPPVPEILGQHHGYSPQVEGRSGDDESFGGSAWQREREALVEALKKAMASDWPENIDPVQARVLAGLTTVADWIGSGRHFDDPSEPWEDRVDQAVHDAGYIPFSVRAGLGFEDIFPFSANEAQARLSEAVEGPGVYLLEAPMGMGKTEAALYAAYGQLAAGKATGIYFALPTQLTSNRIHARFQRFLEGILEPGDPMARAMLLHSGAWLVESEMGEEGRPGGSWFSHAKRGLLFPFAVGTLDQALMAVMNVKHGFVRAFGLAGKVVVLDEVHTYDAYTGTLLDELVDFLCKAGCTVIILTATLSRPRRNQLLHREAHRDDYPLVTSAPEAGDVAEIPLERPRSRSVELAWCRETEPVIEEALRRAFDGQHILWIENSVFEAQERFRVLSARARDAGIEIGLLHSRFTASDRESLEDRWVGRFGRGGRAGSSGGGCILVGTQVLEQSLDIDADYLVARFCPTDMLFQRLGRLWRHEGTARPAGSRCEAAILAPALVDAVENPSKAFGSTEAVYDAYVLCRSLGVWQDRGEIKLPEDIRPMIDATYRAREETGPMARWLHELHEGNRRKTGISTMRRLARGALSLGGKTQSEDKAGTRYSDMESTEVLLLSDIRSRPDNRETIVTLLDGSRHKIPWDRHVLQRREWRVLSVQLARQKVRVAEHQAPRALPVRQLRRYGLGNCFYLGQPEDEVSSFRVGLVNDAREVVGLDGHAANDKFRTFYRHELGYQAERRKD